MSEEGVVGEQLFYSPKYKEMLDRVPTYLQEHNLSREKFNYWEASAQKVLRDCGTRLEFFNDLGEGLMDKGDKLIVDKKATGYNILSKEKDMDIGSNKPLLFYNCHVSRTWHFGLLFAEMEQANLINRNQVALGKRGTKVLYDGDWELIPEDEMEDKVESEGTSKRIVKTVETVATFLLDKDDLNGAVRIADFLVKKTDAKSPNSVPGSWFVQDIRGTEALVPLLDSPHFSRNFGLVVSNLFINKNNNSRMIALREVTQLEGAESYGTILNGELIKYISLGGVGK